MKISLLIHTIYGIGGTIRTTLNLAEELASRHEVEIVSVFRHRDIPLFDIDPRITVVPLVDTRTTFPDNEKEHPDHQKPAEFFPRHEARYKEYSQLTDDRVRAHYTGSDADVVIGTRPGLVAYAAQFAPVAAVVIGQEHMTYHHHKEALREEMRTFLTETDAFVTVSEGDAEVWRERMPLPDTRILSIPNSVPEPDVPPSDTTGNIIVAAGRLSREKQYEVLLKAFAKVVALRPDWTLRIYGWGPEREKLRQRVQKLRLYNSVQLMGPRSPIEPEWVKGAIAVSTSRHESFGMTLVEAMRGGLPVVSTDCDYGPREIIKDGVDGLLVPVGDAGAVSDALLRLIDDEQLRRTMGAKARENARRYDPAAVAKRYADLFAELGAGATQRNGGAPVSTGPRSTGFAPVADAVARPDGSVTVRLVTPEAAVLKHPGLQLLCTRIGDGSLPRTYPLDLDGTVTIPVTDDFADGHWMCHADQPATGLRVGILARAVDQRGSLRVSDRLTTGAGVRHLVPYRRPPKQHLVLRSWVRSVHAEAADVLLVNRKITLTGRLVGEAEPSGEPSLLLRRADDPQQNELVFPGTREGTRGFEVTIGCEVAVAHQRSPKDTWEVWLRYSPGEEPVRVGRVLDDVVQKGDVFVYPEVLFHKQRPLLLARRVLRRLWHRQQRLVKVKLAYDRDNALVLHVSDR
ncbi:glycosyltransferase family 4 protein [Streptomyces sp. NPDC005963]|uniref:glycosyltransferase family 4 protein n=1 Tax=Streptomyces sp. NPDC005963 TaxID=3156721 RepID=UPI00340B177F